MAAVAMHHFSGPSAPFVRSKGTVSGGVFTPLKDIAGVKNAYEIYERLDELDPYSVNDLLT